MDWIERVLAGLAFATACVLLAIAVAVVARMGTEPAREQCSFGEVKVGATSHCLTEDQWHLLAEACFKSDVCWEEKEGQ